MTSVLRSENAPRSATSGTGAGASDSADGLLVLPFFGSLPRLRAKRRPLAVVAYIKTGVPRLSSILRHARLARYRPLRHPILTLIHPRCLWCFRHRRGSASFGAGSQLASLSLPGFSFWTSKHLRWSRTASRSRQQSSTICRRRWPRSGPFEAPSRCSRIHPPGSGDIP
jgi:hypothetical protein